MRSSLLAFAAVSTTLLAACDGADTPREQIHDARHEANQKINEVRKEANQEINQTQADAAIKINEVKADFATLRENYRHDVNTSLTELDHKIADMEARAKAATGKEKVDLEVRLKGIRSDRDAFRKDYDSLEQATAETWEATKARVDAAWDRLKASVS